MAKKTNDLRIKVLFFISILYTISIIAITFSITYYVYQIKTKELIYDYKYEVLTLNEYDLFTQYLDSYFKDNRTHHCNSLFPLLQELTHSIKVMGNKLSNYGKSSSSILTEKDYDYLKRKYYLIMLKEYNILWQEKNRCDNINIGLFFFKKDHNPSLIMGRVYEEIAKKINNTYILSFDIDYNDIGLLNYIKKIHEIKNTDAPYLIFNEKCTIKGVKTVDEVLKYIEENHCINK